MEHSEPAPPRTEFERTRRHLAEAAEQLAQTERTLRADADTLAGRRR
jgi:hypothetical protein